MGMHKSKKVLRVQTSNSRCMDRTHAACAQRNIFHSSMRAMYCEYGVVVS